jgi:hypothetical protein
VFDYYTVNVGVATDSAHIYWTETDGFAQGQEGARC